MKLRTLLNLLSNAVKLLRTQAGTGLGLPIVRSLIEMHGGSLDLQSAVGDGTTVTIRFPAGRAIRQVA